MRRPLTAVLMLWSAPAAAQMPALPVFQNAFANPGFTVAANYGRADVLTTFALAGAWAPSSGRFQVSGGIGSIKPDEGDSDLGYAGRASAGVYQMMAGALGFGVFGGIGYARDARLVHGVAGLSAGYRRALGAGGISAFLSPYYLRATQEIAGDRVAAGLVRFGAGVDVSFFRRFGITVGADAGSTAGDGDPGPREALFGVGLSFAFGGGS